MRRLSAHCACLVFALFGCSSKADATPGPVEDAGMLDTGHVGDAKPDVIAAKDTGPIYPEFTCGPGPYADEELKLFGQTLGAASMATPKKVSFTLSACPEVKGQTDDEGYAVLHLTIGKPTSIRLEAEGFLPTRWYERTPQKWAPETVYGMVASKVKASLEGLDQGTILVDAYAPMGTTCTVDGIAFSVEGHPEAVVKYRSPMEPFAVADAVTATTAAGIATISGITGVAAGATVKVIGTKAGCGVFALAAPGGVALEANTVSRVEMVVHDPGAHCGPPPWYQLSGVVANREMSAMMGAGIADVTVDFLGCGAPATTKSDMTGGWKMYVSAGMPTVRRASLAGYVTSMSSEQGWPFENNMVNFALRKASDWTPLMPGYDTTHTYAIVGIAAPMAGACAGPDGVSITVTGQPDAKVIYADGEPPKDTKGTATTKKGYAYLSGLTPGMLAKGAVTGTKGACKYTTQGGIDTGNAMLEAGALVSLTLFPVTGF